ncbi:MAG: quinone-dependent dihydroorotate dehydrogenase, partial [Pyrinomonadaceae bacterium]
MSLVWQKIIRPMFFCLDAERAHEIGIGALRLGIVSGNFGGSDDEFGDIERFGLKFSNPIGMAAGFDKNGLVVDQLANLGFGAVEVGTVTLEPQTGNEKPRLFRLPEDKALINRLGFNNQGAERIAERLGKIQRNCIVGVNIGKNRNVPNEEAVENYLQCFDRVYEVADYVAVNISSPNTPNLRELQRADNLEALIVGLQERNGLLSSRFSGRSVAQRPPEDGAQNEGETTSKPLLVKIAPDLCDAEIEAIVDIFLRHKISGIIATNTTIQRQKLKTGDLGRFDDGGLSGMPLAERSNRVISAIYK